MNYKTLIIGLVAFIAGFGALANWPVVLTCLFIIGALLGALVAYDESQYKKIRDNNPGLNSRFK